MGQKIYPTGMNFQSGEAPHPNPPPKRGRETTENPRLLGIRRRKFKNHLFTGMLFLFSFLTLVPLILILFYVIREGVLSINWSFFTHLPKGVGETGGGIVNAILGTFLLVSLACLISLPVGIPAGVYLAEHAKTKFSSSMRLCAQVIQGVPSIVMGLMGYLWVVRPLMSFSALSGGVALALMMIPGIVCATEETLKVIPQSLKEAALSLGVPYWRTMVKVILPAALSGVVTGVMVGLSRVAGETAPLLFTAFGNPYISFNLLKPVHALPLMIYTYAISPYPEWHQLAWAASLVLILFVFLLNLISKGVVRRWSIQWK